MNGKSKTVKLSVMLILMIALMFSTAFMMIIKATEDTEKTEEKDAKYNGEYTIEYLIKHFNLVTLKDVSQVEHIVGPVLIGGNVNSTNLCHSQITGGISSYIKGKINGGNVSNNEEKKPTLYLGNASNATINPGGGANINGQWYTNNPTVITDNYLNFDILFNEIRKQSKSIVDGEYVKPDKDGKIEIEIGKKVIIKDISKASVINITGERNNSNLTLINIEDSGSVKLPQLNINGSQTSTDESNSTGTAVIWNIPYATSVQMADSPSLGHIIAPNANITTGNTNYAGCMIANSLDGHIEGHYWKYNGISLPLKEIPKEEPKDKNNTTQNNTTKPSNNTTESKNNTTKPSNNTTESKNNTTKPSNNTTGNNATASKNNTTKPKNNTTGNSATASKNNTTKNNVAVANKTNKTNTSKNEDGMVLGAEWEKNNTSKNKTDKTTADGKLPQTGDEFSQKVVLVVVMIALVVVFGAKYIKHKNELDANK